MSNENTEMAVATEATEATEAPEMTEATEADAPSAAEDLRIRNLALEYVRMARESGHDGRDMVYACAAILLGAVKLNGGEKVDILDGINNEGVTATVFVGRK